MEGDLHALFGGHQIVHNALESAEQVMAASETSESSHQLGCSRVASEQCRLGFFLFDTKVDISALGRGEGRDEEEGRRDRAESRAERAES